MQLSRGTRPRLWREAGQRSGYAPERLSVGLYSMGYVADTSQQAWKEYYSGYAGMFTKIGRSRTYPHRGIAPFTYLLQGEFEHYDSRRGFYFQLPVDKANERLSWALRRIESLPVAAQYVET